MTEVWLLLRPTIERIAAVQRCTVAEAQLRLIDACASGKIRARWLGYYEQTCPPIPKTDWIGADIDLDSDRIVKADGNRMAYVGFSRDDLERLSRERDRVALLAATKIPPASSEPAPSPRHRKSRKQDAAEAAIQACFPQGLPDHIDNKSFLTTVFGWLKCHRPEVRMDNRTMLRAAGRSK
jgi:hypothetical protein